MLTSLTNFNELEKLEFLTTTRNNVHHLTGLVGVSLAGAQTGNPTKNNDPTYDGIFTTPSPYVAVNEYNPPEDKQDKFDWKLSQVRCNSHL